MVPTPDLWTQRIGSKRGLQKGYQFKWIKVVIRHLLYNKKQLSNCVYCAPCTEVVRNGHYFGSVVIANSSVSESLIQV